MNFRVKVDFFCYDITSKESKLIILVANRVVLVREPASFWRENVVAIVTLLRSDGNKLSNVRSFIILRSGKCVNSLTKDNSANFSSEK